MSKTEASQVVGSLLLRDGLPIIDPTGAGHVNGAMLSFTTSKAAEEAYDRISALEPDRHYRWGEAHISGVGVNVLFGRSPRKGSVPCEDDEWNGWDDPLFRSALDVVDETLHSQEQFEWDLRPLSRLQMAYLFLWSAIERYVTERQDIYRADRPDQKMVLDPESPEKALAYYYQIRSNITHRGKGVVRDHERVLNSLRELLSIFRGVLEAARADAQT